MARKRRRPNWPFLGIAFGCLAGLVAYVLIAASVQAAISPYRFSDLLVPRAVDCLVFIWLFWVGSAVGSFLNVVAWRMPRGRSINGFSHCPRCNQRLSAWDNWPVFGWLALRGRCRTCRLPISPRYPIVELLVGISITLIGLVEIYAARWNLPNVSTEIRGHTGPMSMPVVSREVIGIWFYHTVAISCSWATGLIRFDGMKLPNSLIRFVLAGLIIPMLIWRDIAIVPWQGDYPADWPQWSILDSIVRVITSLVAAAFFARLLARYLCPQADIKFDPFGQSTQKLLDLMLMFAIPAIMFGWQSFIGVVVIALLISAGCQKWLCYDRQGFAWLAISIPIAITIQLMIWRPLIETKMWPSPGASPWLILCFAAAPFILPAIFGPTSEPHDRGLQGDQPLTELD